MNAKEKFTWLAMALRSMWPTEKIGGEMRKHKERHDMKRYVILAVLGLSACETPAEISAREQLDAACLAGNLQACAAVQQRVAAENLALATSSLAF